MGERAATANAEQEVAVGGACPVRRVRRGVRGHTSGRSHTSDGQCARNNWRRVRRWIPNAM